MTEQETKEYNTVFGKKKTQNLPRYPATPNTVLHTPTGRLRGSGSESQPSLSRPSSFPEKTKRPSHFAKWTS